MTVQADARPDTGSGELYQISSRLAADFTEVICAQCGLLEHTGSGFEGHVPHGAEHALVTGHAVTERRVIVHLIRAA